MAVAVVRLEERSFLLSGESKQRPEESTRAGWLPRALLKTRKNWSSETGQAGGEGESVGIICTRQRPSSGGTKTKLLLLHQTFYLAPIPVVLFLLPVK